MLMRAQHGKEKNKGTKYNILQSALQRDFTSAIVTKKMKVIRVISGHINIPVVQLSCSLPDDAVEPGRQAIGLYDHC